MEVILINSPIPESKENGPYNGTIKKEISDLEPLPIALRKDAVLFLESIYSNEIEYFTNIELWRPGHKAGYARGVDMGLKTAIDALVPSTYDKDNPPISLTFFKTIRDIYRKDPVRSSFANSIYYSDRISYRTGFIKTVSLIFSTIADNPKLLSPKPQRKTRKRK